MMRSLNPPGNMICILAARVFARLGNTPVIFSLLSCFLWAALWLCLTDSS